MSGAWPPPPDLESIQELVRDADVEGLIEIHGAPADEYEPEAEAIFGAIGRWATADLVVVKLLPVLEGVWSKSFRLDGAELTSRRPALMGVAEQIERFFGPQAVLQTR